MTTGHRGSALRALWAGELSLTEAFWWYGILYGFLVNVLTSFAALALVTFEAPAWLVGVAYLLPLPYNLLILVGVWRSAARWQGEEHWANLARLAIVLWVVAATAL